MFKKKILAKNKGNLRKRANEFSEEGEDKPLQIEKKPLPSFSSSSSDPSFASLTKLVANSKSQSSSSTHIEPLKVIYASSGKQRTGPDDLGATRTINIDGDEEEMQNNQRNKNIENDLGDKNREKLDDDSKSKKRTTSDTSLQNKKKPKFHRIGPQLAPSYLRVTSRMDYQPDICKDYKETGFCGYGDSCKFLHDRGDYKLGWELDNEWNTKQREKLKSRDGAWIEEEGSLNELEDNEDSSASLIIDEQVDEDDTLPFACYLCRKSFTSPIVTKCEHYFCELCILKHSKSSLKCPVCNSSTMGLFKPARQLLQRLKDRELRIAAKEKSIQEANLHMDLLASESNIELSKSSDKDEDEDEEEEEEEEDSI